MARHIGQLNLPPTGVERLGNAVPSPANSVGNAQQTPANLVGKVNLAALVLRAGSGLQMQHKEMADLFGLSEADFSSAFSPNRMDRNRLMKIDLPLVFARKLAIELCEATGLAVSGADAERHALGDLLAACASYIRVVQR